MVPPLPPRLWVVTPPTSTSVQETLRQMMVLPRQVAWGALQRFQAISACEKGRLVPILEALMVVATINACEKGSLVIAVVVRLGRTSLRHAFVVACVALTISVVMSLARFQTVF